MRILFAIVLMSLFACHESECDKITKRLTRLQSEYDALKGKPKYNAEADMKLAKLALQISVERHKSNSCEY